MTTTELINRLVSRFASETSSGLNYEIQRWNLFYTKPLRYKVCKFFVQSERTMRQKTNVNNAVNNKIARVMTDF